jgi:hypothetical protein
VKAECGSFVPVNDCFGGCVMLRRPGFRLYFYRRRHDNGAPVVVVAAAGGD